MTAERRTRISRLQWSCWIPAGTGRIRFGGWRNYDVQWRRWVEFHRAFHPESGRFSVCESLCDDVSETGRERGRRRIGGSCAGFGGVTARGGEDEFGAISGRRGRECERQEAEAGLSPRECPEAIHPAVAAVWESLEVAGKEASLEAAASEGKFPYMEAFVYNRALLLAYAEDLEKAERCCRLLHVLQGLTQEREAHHVHSSTERRAAKGERVL